MNDFTEIYIQQLQNSSANRFEEIKKIVSTEEPTQELVIKLLQIAIIDEFLAEYNYFRSYNLSQTDGKADFDPEFKQHEDDQNDHRHQIADRLRELNARISLQQISNFVNVNSVGQLWKQENSRISSDILIRRLDEQKQAVEFYQLVLTVIDKMTDKDTTTYSLIRDIKADEEQHVKDLTDLALERDLLKDVMVIQ